MQRWMVASIWAMPADAGSAAAGKLTCSPISSRQTNLKLILLTILFTRTQPDNSVADKYWQAVLKSAGPRLFE